MFEIGLKTNVKSLKTHVEGSEAPFLSLVSVVFLARSFNSQLSSGCFIDSCNSSVELMLDAFF